MGGKYIDMTGWKMWEHGYPNSTLIVIKRANRTDSRKMSIGNVNVYVVKFILNL